MKALWVTYTTTLALIVIGVCMVVWLIHPALGEEFGTSLLSPLSSDFSLPTNNQVTSLDIWKPATSIAPSLFSSPTLSAHAALSYDLTTDQFLFQYNHDKKMPMASLTKIMTAIVALEHPLSSGRYSVSSGALVGEDSMGLEAGEVLSLEELLYGLMLHSGNDAAEVLASAYPTGREGFIKAMNEKAVSLGLHDTHFTNPTGLEGDGNQYTTAENLLVITRYALVHFPLFGKVSQTVSYTILQTQDHKAFDLYNETNLLTSYPGVKGVKTGYTPEAGLCLVTYLSYKGHDIIAVLLNSENRRTEMRDILDYSLHVLHVPLPSHS